MESKTSKEIFSVEERLKYMAEFGYYGMTVKAIKALEAAENKLEETTSRMRNEHDGELLKLNNHIEMLMGENARIDDQLEEKNKEIERLQRILLNNALDYNMEDANARLQEENERLKEIITQMRESTWNDIKTIQKLQADNE